MDQEHAFLDAIRQEPDANDLRLIFADWLEDRGNPRAELIRLQCENVQLDAVRDDPRILRNEERISKLISANGSTWIPGAGPKEVTIERGLLGVSTDSEEWLSPEMQPWIERQLPWISQIKINGPLAKSTQNVLRRVGAQGIPSVALNVTGSSTHPGGRKSLSLLTAVRKLSLTNVHMSNLTATAVCHARQLQSLSFSTLREKPDTGWREMRELEHLREIKAYWAGSSWCREVARLPALESVSLINPISLNGDDLVPYRHLERLIAFELTPVPFSSELIQGLSKIENLRRLTLFSNHSSNKSKELSSLAQLQATRLESLRLQAHGQGAHHPWLQYLVPLRLKDLDLSTVAMDSAGTDALKNMKTLQRLILTRASVTDPDLQYLQELPQLKELCLTGNPISDRGIAYLQELPKLEVLILSELAITQESLRTLAQIPSLKWLNIRRTNIPLSAAMAFSQDRPDVYVVS